VKIVRRIISGAHVLGAVSAALLLVGCADRQEVTAPAARLKETSDITVSSEITLFDKTGRVRNSYRVIQQLRSTFRNGIALASVVAPSKVMTISDSTAAAVGYTQPLTPVTAVGTGSMTGNANTYVYDTTTGKRYHVVATGPMIYNYPVTDAYTYNSSGQSVAEIHFTWGAVPGGYALLQQKQIGYSSTGTVTATIVSVVASPAKYATATEPVSRRLGSLLTGVTCYFAPKVAYAQETQAKPTPFVGRNSMPLPGSACWYQGATFALNTGTVAVESMGGVLALWELPLYIGAWTTWTYSLIDFLECLMSPPQPRCIAQGTCW